MEDETVRNAELLYPLAVASYQELVKSGGASEAELTHAELRVATLAYALRCEEVRKADLALLAVIQGDELAQMQVEGKRVVLDTMVRGQATAERNLAEVRARIGDATNRELAQAAVAASKEAAHASKTTAVASIVLAIATVLLIAATILAAVIART